MKKTIQICAAGLLCLSVWSCGGSANDMAPTAARDDRAPNASASAGGTTGGGGFAGEGGGGETAEPFVPETEVEAQLQVPQSGEHYVFVVSKGLDSVVRIDAETLAVTLIEVGGEPTLMRTRPGTDELVVVNEGTQDYSLVRAAGEVSVDTLDAPTAVNRLEISPDGSYAVAWYDPEQGGPVGDLQQIQVLRLDSGNANLWPVGVGFHPSSIQFEDGGSRVFVVTDQGVSIVDMAALGGAGFAVPVPVTPDPFESPLDREVMVTPDGAKAVVRRGGVDELRVVDLKTGATAVATLDGPPTDLDLSADATEALVTIRDVAQLVRVRLSDIGQTHVIDLGETPAGLLTLTADGKRALLHTSLPGNEWLAMLDLETEVLQTYNLQKGVKSVAPAPDGRAVVVLHDRVTYDGDSGDVPKPNDPLDIKVDAAWGYSVVMLDDHFVRLELTDTEPLSVVMLPDGARAYVLLPAPGQNAVDAVDLRSAHPVRLPMGSPPEHAVYVPAADRVAVSQEHPVGRITFIDPVSDALQTVTGFELNGLIQ